MRKILILTAGFGNGHNAAAFNLRDALETVSEDAQVEVLDLFQFCYGRANDVVRKIFLGMVEYTPTLWGSVYSMLDRPGVGGNQMKHFTRLREALRDLLQSTEPDVVVSTYPVYNLFIQQIYQDHWRRPFSQITVVTDSLSVHSLWHAAPCDHYVVANPPTAEALVRAGVPRERIHDLGFPVSPRFHELATSQPQANGPMDGEAIRLLYLIHHGRKKTGRILERLLEIPNLHLTLTCGADPVLKGKLVERTEPWRDRVHVLGWTNQMPELLRSSHLAITKAGGAIVQEAIAAGCPLLINQVIPGQEEGNATLVEKLGIGAVAASDDDLVAKVGEAFRNKAALWWRWRQAIQQQSRPDAALRIAEFILQECRPPEAPPNSRLVLFSSPSAPSATAPLPAEASRKLLLCDFHTHTNYSDGRLTVSALVDFYGTRGFDCLCVTDHIAEKSRLCGKLANLSNLTLPWGQLDEYFEVLERERKRAWKKYQMLVLTGLEFNLDGLTQKSSAHLLGIDLRAPIRPDLGMKELIHAIHGQGALAVASHPHEMKSIWGKNTFYLWENQEEFAPLLDAWEIANRDDLFNPVGLKRLPFLGNSDFHKPKHIHSWKTLLHCEKDPEAIKECIRVNRDISLTLYRDADFMANAQDPGVESISAPASSVKPRPAAARAA